MNKSKTDWRKILRAWWPAIACMIAIFLLSSRPKLPHTTIIGDNDKINHMIAYFVLALLSLRGIRGYPPTRKIGPYTQAFIISSIYGASDEFHQLFVKNRTMDMQDWIADVFGAFMAMALAAMYYRHKRNGGR